MVEAAVSFGGRLDVLVNNAGCTQVPANVVDIDPDTWQQVLDVNLTGPMLLMKAAVPHMMRAGGGSIINISSLAGLRAIPEMPAYAASKGALVMLTQQVALDFGRHKIRCNCICPGGVKTDMNEGAMGFFTERLHTDVEGVYAYYTKGVPLRRIADPSEIAGICSYLASDDATFVDGSRDACRRRCGRGRHFRGQRSAISLDRLENPRAGHRLEKKGLVGEQGLATRASRSTGDHHYSRRVQEDA